MRRLLTDDPHLRRMLELATLLGAEMGDFGAGSSGTLVLSTNVQAAKVATSESSSSAVYGDLATVGPTVSLAVAAGGVAIVTLGFMGISSTNTNFDAFMSFAASGTNTIAASDNNSACALFPGIGSEFNIGNIIVFTGLTVGGSTTFTAKYRTTAASMAYSQRCIQVLTY